MVSLLLTVIAGAIVSGCCYLADRSAASGIKAAQIHKGEKT